MSEHNTEAHTHHDQNKDIKRHDHSHTHEHSHEHTHDHNHGHEDPFSNPSKFFVMKYAFRNYLRRRTYYKTMLKHLNLSGSEAVLDFGSGSGTLAKKIAPKVPNGQLYCLDTSAKFLDYTKNQLKKYSNVNYLFGDLESQNLSSKSFDYITSTWVLHHLDKNVLIQTIKSFHSILKDNGKIFIIEFPEEYEHGHHIHSSINTSEILTLFSNEHFIHKTLLTKKAGILFEISKEV